MLSEQEFFAMLNDGGTHRKQFSQNSGVQKAKSSPTFSVPFDNGLLGHFKEGTGKDLRWNGQHQQFYCFLRSETEIEEVEAWECSQGTRVFIRNLLNSTTALDLNFTDNTSGVRTAVGQLESDAKHQQSHDAIQTLTTMLAGTISDLVHLRGCDAIAPVPGAPCKEFDLPTTLAGMICGQAGLIDLSSACAFGGDKQSVKNLGVEQKWNGWNSSDLRYEPNSVSGKRIIILDDKYQSGVTMHFVASKLMEAGAEEVHGLVAVKTLRDTDNDDVIDG